MPKKTKKKVTIVKPIKDGNYDRVQFNVEESLQKDKVITQEEIFEGFKRTPKLKKGTHKMPNGKIMNDNDPSMKKPKKPQEPKKPKAKKTKKPTSYK